MPTQTDTPTTADEIRRLNAELDSRLTRLAANDAPDGPPSADGEWNRLQIISHIAEASGFFASQLRAWLADPGVAMGRTTEHAHRLGAVDLARVSHLTPGDAGQALDSGLKELAEVLQGLGDPQVQAATANVKYGQEPLMAFLDRYVLHHKAAHVEQLETLIEAGR